MGEKKNKTGVTKVNAAMTIAKKRRMNHKSETQTHRQRQKYGRREE